MEKATTVTMKLLIDTKAKRVLFAEAGKDCVDFLFQILSLPVATVIRLLGEEGMEGSWPNLYKSLQNLDGAYLVADEKRQCFLKPAAPVSGSSVPLLALTNAPAPEIEKKLYTCGYCSSRKLSDNESATCPSCSRLMSICWTYVASPGVRVAADGGGLVKGVVTYMVMDDLEVKPMSTISSLALLNTFKVKDVSVLEEKDVQLGMDEALKLLKASHHSKTVLSDVFC